MLQRIKAVLRPAKPYLMPIIRKAATVKHAILWVRYNYLSRQEHRLVGFDSLTFREASAYFTPWYHDFKELGFRTRQYPYPAYPLNQKSKEGSLFKLIRKAVQLQRENNPKKSIDAIELFCADGFYSLFALQNGVDQIVGYDLEAEAGVRIGVLSQARLASKALGLQDRAKFIKRDVFSVDKTYNLCICAGGLYHIEDPKALLALLRKWIQGPLVIQTVVTNETEDARYFVSPSPGWTWGCRFTHSWLENTLVETGWKIVEQDRNELLGNSSAQDRGSSYFLCIPA